MRAIFKRELGSLLRSFRTYAFAALTLAAASALMYFFNLRESNPQFQAGGQYIALALAAFIPLITAPSFAGERTQHTERLLFMLPVKPAAIVCGKLLACLVPVLAVCLLLAVYPLVMTDIGLTSLCAALGFVAALAFFGIAVTALGTLISSLSPNSLFAYFGTLLALAVSYCLPLVTSKLLAATAMSTLTMLCLLVLVFLVWMLILGGNVFVSLMCTAVCEVPVFIARAQGNGAKPLHVTANLLDKLALFVPLNRFQNGVFDLTSLLWYLTLAAFMAVLTVLILRGKRTGARRALA